VAQFSLKLLLEPLFFRMAKLVDPSVLQQREHTAKDGQYAHKRPREPGSGIDLAHLF
jgi:hypothetical protein